MASTDPTESTECPSRRTKRHTQSVYSAEEGGAPDGAGVHRAMSHNTVESEEGGGAVARRLSTRKLRPEEEYEGIPGEAVMTAPDVGGESVLRGWLWKRGEQSAFKKWKKRWVVLRDSLLYYYEKPTSEKPKGILALDGAGLQVEQMEDKKFLRRPPCFVITTKTLRRFYFHGQDPADTTTWMRKLCDNSPVIMGDPIVYDELTEDDIMDSVRRHFDEDSDEERPLNKPEGMSDEDFQAAIRAIRGEEEPGEPQLQKQMSGEENQDEESSINANTSEVDISSLITDPHITQQIASTSHKTQMAWMMLTDVANQSASLQERVDVLEDQLQRFIQADTKSHEMGNYGGAGSGPEVRILKQRYKELQGRLSKAESDALESSMESSRKEAELQTLKDAYSVLQIRERNAQEKIDNLEQELDQLKEVDIQQTYHSSQPNDEANQSTANNLEVFEESKYSRESDQVTPSESHNTGQEGLNDERNQLANYQKLVSELRSSLAKKGIEIQSLTRDLNNSRQEAGSLRKELLRVYAHYKSTSKSGEEGLSGN